MCDDSFCNREYRTFLFSSILFTSVEEGSKIAPETGPEVMLLPGNLDRSMITSVKVRGKGH